MMENLDQNKDRTQEAAASQEQEAAASQAQPQAQAKPVKHVDAQSAGERTGKVGLGAAAAILPEDEGKAKHRRRTPRREINRDTKKTPMPEQEPMARVANFDEVALGYSQDQAVLEAKRCLDCAKPSCVRGCPVNVPIPQFIEAVRQGEFAHAYEIVKHRNALPAICGRVCPQENQCEGMCVLGRRGDSVGIGYLERFVADWAMAHPQALEGDQVESDATYDAPKATEHGAAALMANTAERARHPHGDDMGDEEAQVFSAKHVRDLVSGSKVACIGSGPSALTCADALAREGVDVTVFEALHQVGGVLSYGIPEFRLPKRLVAQEVATLEKHGVKFQVNSVIGQLYDIPELMGEMGFDAVYVASGAGAPIYLGIPDEMHDGVMMANELLTRSNLMRAFDFPEYETPLFMGRSCAVIGGGNVAMDAARTVKRFGADVTIVYRRSREELPAREEEVHHAEEEGVKFRFLTNPVEIIADDRGWVQRLDCVKMELGTPDLSGRRRPVEIPGSRFPMNVDMVVVAVGNRPNQLVQNSTPGLGVDDRGRIRTNKETHETNIPGVYAGGDVTTGAATVIQAMGTGKSAARSILGYLARKERDRLAAL